MGSRGRYEQRANYIYENEDDRSPKQPPLPKYTSFERSGSPQQPDLNVTDRIVEHVSEDEKSTSSEEVVFEEWTEEFRCLRTDEVDRRTNQILRTTIDETSDRIKGDVIKEHYKEKNTRIKGRKSYDVIREIPRRIPQRIEEQFPAAPPPSSSSLVPRSSSSTNRQWTSEDIYTTEIVHDPHLARELESTAQKFDSTIHYDRVRPSDSSPPPPTTRYDRISTVVTPTTHYADVRKQEPEEEVVSEEYQVEIESPTKRGQTSDWRNKLKEIYSPTSDDDQVNTSKKKEIHFVLCMRVLRRKENSSEINTTLIPYSLELQAMEIISHNAYLSFHPVLNHVSKKSKSDFPVMIKHHLNDENSNHHPRHDIR